MDIKIIEEYPKKMAIEGSPSELYALLNSAINALTKSMAIYNTDSDSKVLKELKERRKEYIDLFDELNTKIKDYGA